MLLLTFEKFKESYQERDPSNPLPPFELLHVYTGTLIHKILTEEHPSFQQILFSERRERKLIPLSEEQKKACCLIFINQERNFQKIVRGETAARLNPSGWTKRSDKLIQFGRELSPISIGNWQVCSPS